MNKQPLSIFWFRRDLRLHDNAGLYHALKSGVPVLPIFVFDTDILNKLSNQEDARVSFIHQTLSKIQEQLVQINSSILILYGNTNAIFSELLLKYNIKEVFANHDYEPYAIQRDESIKNILRDKNIPFSTFKDQVIFEKEEIISANGSPYKVYTPYKNKWLSSLSSFYLKSYPTENYFQNFIKNHFFEFPSLEKIGFRKTNINIPPQIIKEEILKDYDKRRDYPSQSATSLLGIHLRFGTISVRETAKKAQSINPVWLNELIWREFFMQLLFHFPYVVKEPFQPKFKHLIWRNNEKEFLLWCSGNTGYPLVDAGMRELNTTGHMHNRVRMVVASFLTKHLLIDWRWGEAYFAKHLLDYDLSANNGNWQWSAGTGADAQPFFRIFNPYLQQERFDPKFEYIKKWVPEYGTFDYVSPIINHKLATDLAKEAFKKITIE
ncbi:MAG: deoxyribodipyrimidine photo-lyase [Cytophagales bacterium]|nr:MAG: deoxyribodipyrimidine photo-lyase [Cytophagales bacterium]